MKVHDLTQDQVTDLLKAAQMFLDGDFYSAGDINYQTGYDMNVCQWMADQFSVIRSLKID